MNRTGAIILALIILSSGAPAAELQWREYANARFGYVLTYPASLIAGPESTNGAGRELHSRDGDFSLAVSAHFFVEGSGDSFDTRWQEELSSLGGTITYKRKAANWYVVSGVAKDGTEYYHKLYRKGENWAAFQITYPHAKHEKYDAWVAQIEKRFVPFREGDFDRID